MGYDEIKLRLFLWQAGTTLLMAFFLYSPVKKIIFNGRLKRAERNLDRETDVINRKTIERKSTLTALIICIIFSLIFNYYLIWKMFDKK